jgi:5,6-dimethylbenzimidazole synthase
MSSSRTEGENMDVFTAIRERRSCRDFLPAPLAEEAIEKILEAAIWAPSAMNAQPWEFIVITNQEVKENIYSEAEERRKYLLEKSGWKWLGHYQVDFILSAPVIIAVVGNPDKTGADRFLEGGGMGYQHACAAAIQNMLLTAHALGLGSLWFTLFDFNRMREILGIDPVKVPLALVCIGKAVEQPQQTGRKDALERTKHIR